MITVIKRNGETEDFNKQKIINAVSKSFISVGYSTGEVSEYYANIIAENIEKKLNERETEIVEISTIEDMVYSQLVDRRFDLVAKSYEGYRAVQEYKRHNDSIDKSIDGILNLTNKEIVNENSNKNSAIISTQRDLMAGEVSKHMSKKYLLPTKLVNAHNNGSIHIHDMDYLINPNFNCCLVNMKDMLDNGTVINGKMIESPKSFQVACNVMTQIMAQISSNQYGGQSIDISCLGKYLRKSYEKNIQIVSSVCKDEDTIIKLAEELTQKNLESGVQTIQYQINTLMTANGQSPFVTLFMYIREDDVYKYEVAKIIEEILIQRIKGVKNEKGVYVTPAFPKLIYVLDENNIHEDSEFRYLTDTAIRCSAKRLYPDYISAKIMKQNYEGNVFSPMGCRSFLSPYKDENGKYKFDGRFNIGVCSINLPQIAIMSEGDRETFFDILSKRLELCKEVGIIRYNHLKNVSSDVSPIHWQHGAIARLGKHEKISRYLKNGYSTVSLGYIGLYEVSKLMVGQSNTSKEGRDFCMAVINFMNKKIEEWKKETGLAFGLYGTPAESLTHRFCSIDKERFGIIKDITDKGYYTNSFHVDVREKISAFEKFKYEAEFQNKSLGGCISYIEIPYMMNNLTALKQMVKYIYDNIQYAEFNTKSDYCHKCGFDGEIKVNKDNEWECPQCGNIDKDFLSVVRRTCGLTKK